MREKLRGNGRLPKHDDPSTFDVAAQKELGGSRGPKMNMNSVTNHHFVEKHFSNIERTQTCSYIV